MQFKQFAPHQLDEIMKAQKDWVVVQKNHAQPINATIGVLIDPASGAPFQPESITSAMRDTLTLIEKHKDRSYQPQNGNSDYLKNLAMWMLGTHDETWPQAQSLGGTGALHLASDLLLETTNIKQLLIDPGWGNHNAIFNEFNIVSYERTVNAHPGYCHEFYMESLKNMPDGSGVLLQAVGYNNDGHDRSTAEWDEIFEVIKGKDLLTIIDVAYFGLAKSFEYDSYAVRKAASSSAPCILAVSNSKNLGLYQERLGALYALNIPHEVAASWQAQLNILVRSHYSNPPRLAATAAAHVLSDKTKVKKLEAEIHAMKEKVLETNRTEFVKMLGSNYEWVKDTKGLFVKLLFEGFNQKQCDALKEEGILVLPSSRINLGGIEPRHIERFSQVIASVL